MAKEIELELKGFNEFFKKLDDFEKNQLLYTTARAITKTGQDVKESLVVEMKRVFSQPTPYTLNSLYLRPAKKTDLSASISPKEAWGKGTPASKFLYPQIEGGDRHLKRCERALQAVGVLPPGMYIVPGAAAELDGYGNVSLGQLRQILSYFGAAEMSAGYLANMTGQKKAKLAAGSKKKRGFGYSVSNGKGICTNHLPMGIYKRTHFLWGGAIKPVLRFVKKTNYKAIFRFYDVGRKVAQEKFPTRFRESMDEALRTARLK
jgi:hypothetical protein